MSYKQLDQIRDLYESVNDIENRDNELVNEIITVISTSMFVEGYTNVAIKNYFDCADPVEIFEKYEEYSKDFLFVDEKTLNESVEHDLVLDEESIKELNLIIEGLASSVMRGIKRVAAPYLATMKTGARKALKSNNPAIMKRISSMPSTIYGVKDGAKKIKKVSTPIGKSIKDTTSNLLKSAPVSGAIQQGKKLGSKLKSSVAKGANFVKKNPLSSKKVSLGTALGLGAASTAGFVAGKMGGNKESKPDTPPKESPKTDAAKIPSTAEIRAANPGKVGGGNAGASTDSGEGKTYTSTPTQGTPPEKKTEKPKVTETKPKKMSAIEKKNRARFGDAHVDKLKAKQKDFKLMKSKKMSKDDFIKKYPKSITAQQAAGLRDHTEWDAFDIVSNYLIDSNQVDDMDEALYVMTEMDTQTIQGIVEDFEKQFQ